jgi:hypothetical protein
MGPDKYNIDVCFGAYAIFFISFSPKRGGLVASKNTVDDTRADASTADI